MFRLAEYLHRSGYGHGDIAPCNVLLDSASSTSNPTKMHFGCDELFDVAVSLQLCASGGLHALRKNGALERMGRIPRRRSVCLHDQHMGMDILQGMYTVDLYTTIRF